MMFGGFLYIGVLLTCFMDKGYIEAIQEVLEAFVEKSTGIPNRQNMVSVRNKLGGNPNKLPISSILLELKGHGLLESDSHVVLEQRIFFITSKGYFVLQNGGVKTFYKELEAKEGLELKILRQTNQSFELNKYQFWVTLILAIGTAAGLFIQWRSYEIEKVKTELEIKELRSKLESIK